MGGHAAQGIGVGGSGGTVQYQNYSNGYVGADGGKASGGGGGVRNGSISSGSGGIGGEGASGGDGLIIIYY